MFYATSNYTHIYLARWRWNDSSEVVPRAQQNTGSSTPPFVMCPVTVYRAINQLHMGEKTFKYKYKNTTFLPCTWYLQEWHRICSHRKSFSQLQPSHSLAEVTKRTNRNYFNFNKFTHLYCGQSSKYLSCFLIHSLLWISRIAFQSAVGLLPSVRPLKMATTAISHAHL